MFFRAQKRVSSEVSLSEPIDSDGDGNTLALMDVISEDDDMAERIDEQDRTLRLRACIQSALDDRERQIIALRYGVPDGKKCMTQREAAQICGISRSYVSRIEKKALEKLKEAFEKPR
ncbi:MAG: sigma-70 family RNA polymerase sigma factor [Eubacteriales bacterium]|nr:sigma-70 family RNA polymerase sigma factor [Eubacteriales bacterium]